MLLVVRVDISWHLCLVVDDTIEKEILKPKHSVLAEKAINVKLSITY